MSTYPELVLHIGAGKTGSTSIQFSLRKAQRRLPKQNMAYFGLVLETLPAAREKEWCVENAPQQFFRAKNRAQADAEMAELAQAELARLGAQGVTRVVWSNEAFLTRADRMLPIFRRLAQAGVPITPICYVRRHDDWARSGYVQFGLKFKSYPGPIRDFVDWTKGYDMSYAPGLTAWGEAFEALEVYNFDVLENVTQHFLTRVGLPDLPQERANEKPSNALLAIWAAFNNRYADRALPILFQRVARKLNLLPTDKVAPVPPLPALMPTEAQLLQVQSDYANDRAAVNAMLQAQGQPPLADGAVKAPDPTVSDWDMQQQMLTMIFALQDRVEALEAQLEKTGGSGIGQGKP